MTKKRRGEKVKTVFFNEEGYDRVVAERDSILKDKLPAIRQEIENAEEGQKDKLLWEKHWLLKRVLHLNQMLNYSRILEPTPIDLSKVPTCELHAELAKREGVKKLLFLQENM